MLKLTEKYIREQNQQILAQEHQSLIMLEAIADPIILVDSFLNCKQYNNEFKKKFIGHKNTVLFKQEKLWKVFDDEEILDLFTIAKDTGDVSRSLGHQIGSEYYNISITPIKDDQNKNLGLLGMFHNVTDAKLTEKMRVDFVANVSHEIRTPLTSIKGFSQLLLAQKEICPEGLHTPLDRIVSNTERLKDLFDNLLKLSVIESKYELEKEHFDLTQLLKSITSNLRAKYSSETIDIDIPIMAHVYGDAKLLEQVFTNLFDNSVKYSPAKKTNIKVRVIDFADSQQIEIEDDGPGISETDLKRIFERFYRAHTKGPQTVEGTGLGLSIVKHIVNKHNGTIAVDSKLDMGTIFTITLPVS